jgi:hypothetical protein
MVYGQLVSGSYCQTLAIHAVRGRLLTEEDDRAIAVRKTQIANAISAGDVGTVTKLAGIGASAYQEGQP